MSFFSKLRRLVMAGKTAQKLSQYLHALQICNCLATSASLTLKVTRPWAVSTASWTN
jgi:hypothetical protein